MLVKFGSGGFVRAGLVVGEFDHTVLGRVVMVRTTTAALQGQQFDTVPVGKTERCSLSEFLAISAREEAEVLARVRQLRADVEWYVVMGYPMPPALRDAREQQEDGNA